MGVLQRIIFSHTPDEAMSGGLVKACVPGKNCSIPEKIEFLIEDGNSLTPQQTDFIYRKVELGSLINKETIREELDSEAELDKIDDNSGDENPYRELIVNNAYKIENTLSPNGTVVDS